MSSPANTGTAPARFNFPFLDLQAQYAGIQEEVESAAKRVLASQHFILGPEVEAFEQDVARLVGSRYAVSCASGTDSLILSLMALEIGQGDEVITTPFTFVATAGSIARVGAKPVFADIDPQTFNISPRTIEKAITPRTRAVMPVHLFGLAAAMDEIQDIAAKHKLAVIEDAAQAIGARHAGRSVGSIGLMGCFSFFPSKNLGGAGDGGMVCTGDATLADRLRLLRVHGARKKYEYEILGLNSRLDALHAAILRAKLQHLERWTAGRRANAERYGELFREFRVDGKVQGPSETQGKKHVYNQYTIRVSNRDELREHLKQRGIPTEIYYPKPLHLQRAFAYLGYKTGDFPTSESASLEALSLPIYPELTEEQQRAVAAAIADFDEE